MSQIGDAPAVPWRSVAIGLIAGFLLPAVAQAACIGDWDLGGQWTFEQDNGFSPTFRIEQSGSSITGGGTYTQGGKVGIFTSRLDANFLGTIAGSVNGDSFRFLANWYDGSLGEYVGVIDAQGHIAGTTFDKNHPNNRASWHVVPGWGPNGDDTAKCVVVETTTPPSEAPKPIKKLGKAKPPVGIVAAPSPRMILGAPSFDGAWTVSSDKPWGFRMNFAQNGTSVAGTYVIDVNGVAGRIKGTLSGRILNFTWDQDGGYTGDGTLTLAADGASFAGTYRVNDNGTLSPDLLQGKWSGTRQ